MKTLTGLLLAVSLLLTGCGTTPKQIAYKTLSAVGAAGYAAGQATAEAYAKKLITTEQWDSACVKYDNYLQAYNTACRQAAYSLEATPTDIVVKALNEWLAFADGLLAKKGGAQ